MSTDHLTPLRGLVHRGWAVPAERPIPPVRGQLQHSRPRKIKLVSKRTFQPNNRRRHKTHGFRLRMRTRAGRTIIANRRRKGRNRLAV